MHFNFAALLPFVQVLTFAAIPAAAAWIGKHIKTPTDAERATLLANIANGAVALVLTNNRSNDWAQLLEQTVKQITSSMNPPTTNTEVIKRAVASALIQHGVQPPTQK